VRQVQITKRLAGQVATVRNTFLLFYGEEDKGHSETGCQFRRSDNLPCNMSTCICFNIIIPLHTETLKTETACFSRAVVYLFMTTGYHNKECRHDMNIVKKNNSERSNWKYVYLYTIVKCVRVFPYTLRNQIFPQVCRKEQKHKNV
jgi:hypothetical protein